MIIRAACENLYPRLRMRGRKVMAISKHVDLLRRQRAQKILSEFA